MSFPLTFGVCVSPPKAQWYMDSGNDFISHQVIVKLPKLITWKNRRNHGSRFLFTHGWYSRITSQQCRKKKFNTQRKHTYIDQHQVLSKLNSEGSDQVISVKDSIHRSGGIGLGVRTGQLLIWQGGNVGVGTSLKAIGFRGK